MPAVATALYYVLLVFLLLLNDVWCGRGPPRGYVAIHPGRSSEALRTG